MAGKDVVDAAVMVAKIRAAVAARQDGIFLLARTDARAVHGLDEALRRGELYLEAGADGLFIEAPETIEELEKVGRTFQGVPQLANMVEGGGQTPILPPAELRRLGFRDGGLSDHAAVPRRAHDRDGARRSARRPAEQWSRRGFCHLQGHHRLCELGCGGGTIRSEGPGEQVRAMASALLAASLLFVALPANAQDKPEIAKVRLAVGGKPALFYLPLTVTERLGYFKSEGLTVEISDFQGGARSLQALDRRQRGRGRRLL